MLHKCSWHENSYFPKHLVSTRYFEALVYLNIWVATQTSLTFVALWQTKLIFINVDFESAYCNALVNKCISQAISRGK